MPWSILFTFAGVLTLLLVAANLVAVRMFDYPAALRRLPRHVGQVFVSQNVFLMLVLLGIASACFLIPTHLADGTVLARCVSAFMGVFWLLRLLLQLFYYDAEERRRHRVYDVLFTLAFGFLATLFFLAAAVP